MHQNRLVPSMLHNQFGFYHAPAVDIYHTPKPVVSWDVPESAGF
jgi:hypothetical protein